MGARGAFTLAGALTFAELGAALPRAGGKYIWLTEAYGELVGFLHGWANFTVVASGALAALSIVFAEYVGYFVPLGPVGTRAVAIGALLVLALVSMVGVRVAAVVGDALTLAKLGAIGAIVIAAFALGHPSRGDQAWPDAAKVPGASAMAAGMIGVFWSYGGWQHASFAAGEAKHPARDVPRGMIVGTIIVTVVYVFANLAYLRARPMSAIMASRHVASDAVEALVGRAGGRAVAAAIALSALRTASIYTLTAPRLYWAMAERGLFFRGVADLHPRWRTPVRAIALQTAWAVVLVLAWGTFESLISYVVFVDWIFFGLAGAAVFVMRRRGKAADGAYRVPGYPVVPLVFVAVSLWFVLSTLWGQPTQALAGTVLLALGVPVYAIWRKRRGPVAPAAGG